MINEIIPQEYQQKTKNLLIDFSSAKTRKKVESITSNTQGKSEELGINIGDDKVYVTANDGVLYIKYDNEETYNTFIKILNL